MYRFRKLMKRAEVKRALLGGLCLSFAVVAPLTAAPLAQADAPAPTSDARLGALGEQGQPGSEELGAGRAAAMRGRWQEALAHFTTVMEENRDGTLADDATYWTAKSLYELGRLEEAVEQSNEFINQYPRSDLLGDARVVRFEAAEALVSRGNTDYERYLRDEVGPRAPQAPAQAGDAPPAPDPASDLRVMALDALIGMDPEAAWPVLQRLVAEGGDAEMRERAVWLLSQVGTREAFDLLVDLARNDPDPAVRGNALFWLGQSEDFGDVALDLLIDMVQREDDLEGLEQALFGLGQSDSPRAQEALAALAADTSKPVEARGQALFWLGQRPGSLALLRDIALNDTDEEMRAQALFGISQMQSEEANDALLEIARSDASVELRSNAIFMLGQRQDQRALDILMGLWDEVEDIEIRNQLLFAMAQTNSERAVDHLVMIAKDESADQELREQAIFWLGQLDNPKAKAALLEIIGGGVER